jgi:hypothetical protein
MRYAEAVREVIQRHQTLGGACTYASVETIQPYPGAAGQKQIAVVVLTVGIQVEVQ